MKDDKKTKNQLIDELTELRSQKNIKPKKTITESKSADLVAREATRYAESIVETVRGSLLVLDANLKIILANRNFYTTFKVTPGETIGSFIYDLGNKQWDIPKLRELLEDILPKKEAFDGFEVAHNFQDIGQKIMLLNARQIHRKDINSKIILLAIEDITERKQIREALQERELMFRTLFESANDSIFLMDQNIFIDCNAKTLEMFGCTREQIIGQPPFRFSPEVQPDGRNSAEKAIEKNTAALKGQPQLFEWKHCRYDGTLFDAEINLNAFSSGGKQYIQAICRDITERKQAENELRENEQRYHELSILDDLTSLYNSRHFYVQLKNELERSNRYEQPLTLLMLDLDDFKVFNDTYGHIEGDQVLQRLGQVIKRCLRETDSAYRYGGEEFTILLPMTTSADGAVTAERILMEFKREIFYPAPDQEVHLTVSIGLAQYKPKEDVKAFVRRVDTLMYQGKKNGKDRVCSEVEL